MADALYSRVLVALDFSPEARQVGLRAVEVAERCGAELVLLHVVEYLPMDLGDGVMPVEPLGFDEELVEQAEKRLAEVAARFGQEGAKRRVEVGATREAVTRVAAEEQVDLIVVGRHDRHGLALLFGSTADGVLHHAPCDVLAVHIHEE